MGLSNRRRRVGTDTQSRPKVYVTVKFTPLSLHEILSFYHFAIPILSRSYFNLKVSVVYSFGTFAPDLTALPVCLVRSSPNSFLYPSAIDMRDRKSTRLNSSHSQISYAVFC